ncbi:MAG: hypothetical protein EOP87_13960, partial [Verrucomicrobiaceae bacterium]
TPYDSLSELRRMILRDRNHASVFAWSMYNEEPLQGTVEDGICGHEALFIRSGMEQISRRAILICTSIRTLKTSWKS